MSYYASRFGGSPLSMFPPVIKWLLGINVLIFLLDTVILPGLKIASVGIETSTGVHYVSYLSIYGSLRPIDSEWFGIWQYFTYMFLHGGFTHIFFNMIVLWMFGVELEQMWGSKRFLVYYILCGLGAGVIHSVITLLMNTGAPTVGASGAIMGVMIAFGLTFPDRLIFIMFFLPMRAKYAVLLVAGVDLYLGIFRGGDGIAHFAHLGGALVGYLLLKFGSNNVPFPGLFNRSAGNNLGTEPTIISFDRSARRPQPDPQIIEARHRDVQHTPSRGTGPAPMDFGDNQARIDQILDKISVSGYQNLTEEEKAMLQEASKKMR